ncbi:beta-lactamase family protein [Reyranella sp. MMS21-HV4-11]|uniref:Beta-lactamase family protein n=1 Tax=Reyranella humidisoli TaxID=2849149 RepID=A0ABS6IP93_9HYPH|nr:serine hydrolase domain-containing protein [Reyranella sp. MMS21-HV4-11]MBU8875794.1 beta-lactamase family protein [Reyranella sp. MMS21-HV4-11]
MKTIILALALSAFAAEVHAEGWVLPMAAKPEDVGLSSMQLKRIETATQKHIDDGLVPGAVMLVARRGKVAWVSTLGKRDPAASPDPMKADSIFRIYSMTKPIVSLAVMQMVEEGRLQVSDPVSKFLPEMGKMKVAQEKTAADGTHSLLLSDPERPMTVQDLLRHTSGLIYGGRGSSLVNQAYVAAKIGDRSMSNQEFVTKLSTLPLRFSPGARWEYGVSTDVLGRLIEVVDGKTLGESLSERIFKPLGMVDTQFQVPAAKVARAAQPGPRPGGQPMTPRFKVDDGAKYESGGGGLTSTMSDYLRFASMLANGGELNGKRLLGKQTLAFMAADHTGTTRPGRPPGLGFGLGFEVRTMTGEAALPGSIGEYGWAGNAGTLFWVDPKNELTAIYMVQVSDPDRVALRNQFRSMVQAAIID